LRQHLARLRDAYPALIEEIRGEGLMIGLKCSIPTRAGAGGDCGKIS
jgi:acetylornithine/N-succinyldiaminopimelate aminotransferase